MKITFISKYPFERRSDGSLTSGGASARLRILEPALFLSGRGHQVNLLTIPPEERDPKLKLGDDVVVVSKIIDPVALERLAEAAERREIPFVTDICDNRLDHPTFGPPLRRLAAASQATFCNTEEMARVVTERVPGVHVEVLHEPVEGDPIQRKPGLGHPIKLIWFGHQDGLPQLQRDYPSISRFGEERAVVLQIMCGATPDVLRWVNLTNESTSAAVPVSFAPWGPRALREACRVADVAVLPGSDDDFWRTKSPNRMLQALWYGLRVAAYPFPSYRDYGSHCSLDKDISMAVGKALTEHPETDVWADLKRLHSRESVGAAWERTLLRAVAT